MPQELFDLLQIPLCQTEIFFRVLGVVILHGLLRLLEIDLHQFFSRRDIAPQVEPLRAEGTAHVIKATGDSVGSAGSLIDALFQFLHFGFRRRIGTAVSLIAVAVACSCGTLIVA